MHFRKLVARLGARVSRRTAVGLVVALALSAFAYSLFRGAARSIPRVTWSVPPSSPRSWREVYDHAPRIELVSIDTGAVHVSRASMLAPSDPRTAEYREEPEPLRVYAHLVRHPTRGDVLIDSGLDASFAADDYGNIARPARWILAAMMDAPYTQSPGADIASQLARLGAEPRAVFLTHLHMDHTAGIPALPPNVDVVTGPEEADDVYQVFGFGHLGQTPRLHELDFTVAREMPPLGAAIDIHGDGSLWAISTPGHSRGHVSFVVNATAGPVLLTGDASHFAWGFEHDVAPMAPSADDQANARASLQRLRQFAAEYPEVTVFFGHEAPRRR